MGAPSFDARAGAGVLFIVSGACLKAMAREQVARIEIASAVFRIGLHQAEFECLARRENRRATAAMSGRRASAGTLQRR